jgi:hypothetical protein
VESSGTFGGILMAMEMGCSFGRWWNGFYRSIKRRIGFWRGNIRNLTARRMGKVQGNMGVTREMRTKGKIKHKKI